MSEDSSRVAALEAEVARLRSRLDDQAHVCAQCCRHVSDVAMTKDHAERYARQITLKSFGPHAQQRLIDGKALIIGAGGLGCPCALYLASAGVGTLGIVDKDTVSLDNLHRQIAHSEATVGMHKADSVQARCSALNATADIKVYRDGLRPDNAVRLCQEYDVIIDCTDNAPSRYLVNDAAVMAARPLVSGAAVGTDGQLTVYNHADGPCYRCIYPECPAPQNCTRCEDAGVLGPVPGVIGTLQALEAIKILSGVGSPLFQKLLIYDALTCRFSTVKLRGRRDDCAACSSTSQLHACGGPASYDYASFTGGQAMSEEAPTVDLLPPEDRLSPEEAQRVIENAPDGSLLLMDVRSEEHFSTARLPHAWNCPVEKVEDNLDRIRGHVENEDREVLVMCRKGNDSQGVVQTLHQHGVHRVRDVVGGMHAWSSVVDHGMPHV